MGKFVSNGPFRLEARPSRELMVLVRNGTYHGRSTGNVQRVELSLLLPQQSSLALLETYAAGDLDVFHPRELPFTDLDRTRERYAGEFVLEPWLQTHYLGFNTRRPPFDDVRVRRALVLAADRERLASVLLAGFVFPATGGFVPPGMAGHSAGIALPYDPEGARELLAEAGYPSGRRFPTVVFFTRDAAVDLESSEFLRQGWQDELGIEVRLETVEFRAFADRLDREPPGIFAWCWVADYLDPDNFLRVALAGMGWQNPDYEGLVGKASRLTDQRQRMRLYKQADQILVDEAAVVPLFYGRNSLLIKPWVRRFPMSALGGWFWKDIIIEPH